MTNRDLIMIKLIQLSTKEFADNMDPMIHYLMDGKLCDLCHEQNDGRCPVEAGNLSGCLFDLEAWLNHSITNEELTAAAAV